MVTQALIESRAEYAAGSLILVLRWLVRCLTTAGTSRGWRWDDWFTVSVFIWHTALFAMVEYLAVVGAPLGFTQERRNALTPDMATQLEKGAKAMYASFFILIAFVWSAKAVLVAFFLQLTRQTRMHRYVWVVAGISVAGCLAGCLATILHCRPIRNNWQVLQDPGFECSAGVTQNIVIAATNVLVDLMLIVVPINMLRDVQMVLWRKMGIAFLLSLGVFVMAMAIARCILSVDNGPGVAQSSTWVFREALVTIFAINAPVLPALFRRKTWRMSRSRTTGSGYYTYGSDNRDNKSSTPHNHPPTIGGSQSKPKELKIYKMTEIETSSKNSTSNLVLEREE